MLGRDRAASSPRRGGLGGPPAWGKPRGAGRGRGPVGLSLPPDLRASLAVHDGTGRLWLTEYGPLMSVAQVVRDWGMLTDLWWDEEPARGPVPGSVRGPIRRRWWHRGWVPFVWNIQGDHLCLDLAPPAGGVPGQVITWYHNTGPEEVLAPGYAELLRRVADDLASGRKMV